MSDQDSTPAQDPQTPEATPPQIDLDALANKIAQIKTEDGRQKYDSVEKAVESIPHKDEFIDTLKAEVAAERQKREDLEKRFGEMETKVSIEDRIADKIASQQGQDERPSSVDFDEQKLGEMVAASVAAMDTQKQRQANASRFVEAVVSETKDVEAFIKDKAASIGIGVETFQDLIAQSPEAALKLVGVTAQAPVKTKSNVNTQGYAEQPAPVTPRPQLFSKSKDRVARAAELLEQLRPKQ